MYLISLACCRDFHPGSHTDRRCNQEDPTLATGTKQIGSWHALPMSERVTTLNDEIWSNTWPSSYVERWCPMPHRGKPISHATEKPIKMNVEDNRFSKNGSLLEDECLERPINLDSTEGIHIIVCCWCDLCVRRTLQDALESNWPITRSARKSSSNIAATKDMDAVSHCWYGSADNSHA